MSKHSRKIKSSRKGLKTQVLRKLTIKKKKALSRNKTKKGGGWFRNDRPYFFQLLSKAIKHLCQVLIFFSQFLE